MNQLTCTLNATDLLVGLKSFSRNWAVKKSHGIVVKVNNRTAFYTASSRIIICIVIYTWIVSYIYICGQRSGSQCRDFRSIPGQFGGSLKHTAVVGWVIRQQFWCSASVIIPPMHHLCLCVACGYYNRMFSGSCKKVLNITPHKVPTLCNIYTYALYRRYENSFPLRSTTLQVYCEVYLNM